MKIQVQKSIVSKPSKVKKIFSLLPMTKKMLKSKIKGVMRKKNTVSEPSKVKKIISLLSTTKKMLNSRIKGQNTPKRVSNRRIKSVENNFSDKATKNIINTPKIAIEKPQIVTELKVVTSSKIVSKVKKVSKPKIVDKSEIVSENDEDYYKPKRVNNAFKSDYRVYESRGSQYYESLEEYLNKIKPCLENMIKEHMSIREWKLQLTISVKFISSRNPE